MPRALFSIAIMSVLVSWSPVSWSTARRLAPVGLDECYRLALSHGLEMSLADRDIDAARARYTQALGFVLPKVAFVGSETLQDSVSFGGVFGNSASKMSQPQAVFGASLPLFQGLKEVAALRAGPVDRRLQEQKKREAQRLLFLDVARAFFTAIKIDRDISRTTQMIGIYRERVEELGRRVDLGKSRESERASQKAELAFLTAELEKLRGDRAVAYEVMSYFTGQEPQPPLSDRSALYRGSLTLSGYLALANERADVAASKETSHLDRGRIAATRASLLPNAALQSNYYPYRSGFLEDSKWDVVLSVKVPLFDLQSFGELKESRAVAKQSELRAEQKKRIAESEVRKAFAAYAASHSTLSKYQSAAGAAQASYDLMQKDYALGLVTNLDVLQAQKALLDAMRARDDAQIAERMDWAELQAASGRTP